MGKRNRERAMRAWIEDKTMRGTTAMFLVSLSDLASDDHGQIYLSNQNLAERVGRSPRFVTRHRQRLEALGLISVIDRGGPGRTSRWQLFPDHYIGTQGAPHMGTQGATPIGRQGVHLSRTTGASDLNTTGGTPNRIEPYRERAGAQPFVPPSDQHVFAGDDTCMRCGEAPEHLGHVTLEENAS